MENLYLILADTILVIHFAFVGFVILGLVGIWLGYLLNGVWVRNFWFRMAHLAAMGIVVLQAIWEQICPLTIWEMELRLLAGADPRYDTTFMQHWLHQLLYWELSATAFTALYILFFILIAATLWFIPPRKPGRR